MKLKITLGEKYAPAMKLTKQAEADDYFEECIKHNLQCRRVEGLPLIRAEAERIELANLGYWAGYYGAETRERVERLFKCSHPMFGSIAKNGAPTVREALLAGGMMVSGGEKVVDRLFPHEA